MHTCPSLDELRQLLKSQKGTAIDESVVTHVDTCAGCQQRLRELDGDNHERSDRAGRSDLASAPSPALIGTADFDPSQPQPISEDSDTVIGPYKLRQKLGEGGMGTVYEAEQERPIRRRVALKIIKPGMDSERVVARFEAERQALALMSHANIAKVLDGGTTATGRPFFVMELVPGIPITDYCNDQHLTLEQRLKLFIPVCDAIQHAHQKGIIHRDIKPSNILVTLSDGKPTPKVIDFGVAKATSERLSERENFTEYGAVVGTLEYMSPEQAVMSPLGIDTRSDIFSLGVVLYELLAGGPPLDPQRLRTAGFVEALRIIKEEEPAKPSTRLYHSMEALGSLAAQRRIEPAKLPKLVQGELDWIVMKAMEKDRARRYETASHFARDIENYLSGETVEACPPSTGYKLKKFVHRYTKLLLTTAAFVLLLIAAAVISTLSAVRARVAERQAIQERMRAEHATTEAIESHFRRLTEERKHVLQAGLGHTVEQLVAIASAFDTWPTLSRAEFHAFVERALERHPEIQALEWIPRVTQSQRAELEATARTEGLTDFQFRELVPGADSRPAEIRDEYYPVLYVEPLDRNRTALGLDLGASPPRRAALERARDSGLPVASAPIRLAQEKSDQMGFLLFLPVYQRQPATGPATAVADRQRTFRGCALAVFRVGDLVDRVLGELARREVALTIYDDEDGGRAIYQTPTHRSAASDAAKTVQYLEVAGRRWRLESVALPDAMGSRAPATK